MLYALSSNFQSIFFIALYFFFFVDSRALYVYTEHKKYLDVLNFYKNHNLFHNLS